MIFDKQFRLGEKISFWSSASNLWVFGLVNPLAQVGSHTYHLLFNSMAFHEWLGWANC